MQTDEKLDFSKRLKLALKRSPKAVNGAAELALQFNLRHPHDSITIQSAHKWLTGKSRPTFDKIETLANWLNVSAHWLRHGSPTETKQKPAAGVRRTKLQVEGEAGFNEAEKKLITRYRRLSAYQQHLIDEMTEQLAIERETWPGTG